MKCLRNFSLLLLVSGGDDKQVIWWDIRTGKAVTVSYFFNFIDMNDVKFVQSFYSTAEVSSVVFDESLLLCGAWDGALQYWSMIDQKPLFTFTEHSGNVSCVNMNSSYIITGSLDKTLKGTRCISLILLFNSNSLQQFGKY